MMTTPVSIPSAVAPPQKSLRVLYADDMRELRQLLEVVLGRDGHRVESVPDGNYALELVLRDPAGYDVVITDHHMPTVNGLELVARLRAMKFPGKIIVFSSELSEAVDRGYRSHRVDHILPKPIFPSELRALFASL
ncbi:MAG: response regulator [Opitutaceae bacterium]|nr:response regulator [Opitutaceae bacterium]